MAEQPEERHVTLEREAGVAWIRLNRPEKLNPIGVLARQQLDAALKEVERDESVRCVVLIGSGRGFSAGADVREMGSAEGGMRSSEDVGRVLREQYAPMLQRIRSMPKPVICGLNGVAAGIGFLGAGTILKLEEQHRIEGLTSAASVWVTILSRKRR